MAVVQHGMCELTRHGMVEEWHGNVMGAAWHVCISLFSMCNNPDVLSYFVVYAGSSTHLKAVPKERTKGEG
jgi:hypothetical protein